MSALARVVGVRGGEGERVGLTVAVGAVSAAGLIATFFLPPVHFSKDVPSGTGEQLIEAEMTNLRPEDEPIAVPE